MKNYVQEGKTLRVTVPSGSYAEDLAAGDGVLIGVLFGVAQHDAAIGEEVEIARYGVFNLAKTTSQAWTVGQKAYWSVATNKVTTSAGSNKLIGVVVADAGSNDETGSVCLDGTVI